MDDSFTYLLSLAVIYYFNQNIYIYMYKDLQKSGIRFFVFLNLRKNYVLMHECWNVHHIKYL